MKLLSGIIGVGMIVVYYKVPEFRNFVHISVGLFIPCMLLAIATKKR